MGSVEVAGAFGWDVEGVSWLTGLEGSVVSATGAGWDAELSTTGFVGAVARLGLRKRPPSLPAVDFLPSPSVTSASEVASDRFSLRLPKVLKNDERRLSLVASGVMVGVVAVVLAGAAGGSVVSAAATAVPVAGVA